MRLSTSLRERSPSRTWATAQTLMAPLGISRVTDITRQDRLGIPVYASIRPRGRTVRVHAGKGMTADDARVGALMEAVEVAVAERVADAPPDATLTLRTLEQGLPDPVRLTDFAPRLGIDLLADTAVPALKCEAIGSERPVLLPTELVLPSGAAQCRPVLFGWTSNGLASGNSVEEALLHGLLEVLERDAVTMNRASDRSARLENRELPAPFDGLAAQWQRLGVTLIVRHVPNDFGLPCFQAFLHEQGSLDVNLTAGAGLHLDRRIALARAISEAAQARLSIIHGGRDDVPAFYAKYTDPDHESLWWAERRLAKTLASRARRIAFADVPHWPSLGVGPSLARLLRRLAELSFRHVFFKRLVPHDVDLRRLHVVMVIVPGCEPPLGTAVRMGPRLRSRLIADG